MHARCWSLSSVSLWVLALAFASTRLVACGGNDASNQPPDDPQAGGGQAGQATAPAGSAGDGAAEVMGGATTGGMGQEAGPTGAGEGGSAEPSPTGEAGQGTQEAGAGGQAGAAGASPANSEPVVTLVGADVVLDCGATFVDPGASASDAEDGALAVEVAGVAAVDTSQPGDFSLSYSATDSAGSTASVERRVYVCGPSCGELGKIPIDVSGWQIVQYEQNSQPDAAWVVAADGLSVKQTVNADASIFLSDFETDDLAIEGTWTMGSSSDDDFVGFVFGYRDRGHFELFDWKGATQTYEGTQALVGMTLKHVSAPLPATGLLQLTVDDLWATVGTTSVMPVSADGVPLHNSVKWAQNKPYSFSFESHAGSFRLIVRDGETLLADWSVRDAAYTSGKFGFYNFSQGPVQYQTFTRRKTPPACSTVQ